VSLFRLALECRTQELAELQDAYTELAAECHVVREIALTAIGQNAVLAAERDYAQAQVRRLRRAAK